MIIKNEKLKRESHYNFLRDHYEDTHMYVINKKGRKEVTFVVKMTWDWNM